MHVVDLREVRDLLALLDGLRAQVLSGAIVGAGLATKNRKGEEVVIFSGTYLSDPAAALSLAMQVSWELTRRAESAQPVSASA